MSNFNHLEFARGVAKVIKARLHPLAARLAKVERRLDAMRSDGPLSACKAGDEVVVDGVRWRCSAPGRWRRVEGS